MKNKKRQILTLATVTALGVSMLMMPIMAIVQEKDSPVVQDLQTHLQSATKKIAPAIDLPKDLHALSKTTLKDITLPENWTWKEENTVISTSQTEYPAYFKVDDKTYDYSAIEGYNAKEHYIERMLTISIEPVKIPKEVPPLENTPKTRSVEPVLQSAGDIVIDESNFKGVAFIEWLKAKTYGLDGVITQEEISKITSINLLGDNKIKDLSGIEHFTALNTLGCDYSQVSKIDVTKNLALTRLRCSNNQISTLDVTQNPNLIELRCNNTQISSLDVTKNPALNTLTCSSTQISTLDVRKNPVLSSLSCNKTQISEIDVTNNPALTYLNCSFTKISTLDIRKNPALSSLDFSNTQISEIDFTNTHALVSLSCKETNIRELDVNHCPKLTNLTCYGSKKLQTLKVTGAISLNTLECGETLISTLDVSNNSALQTLTCIKNPNLKILNVKGTTALKKLSCYETIIEDLDLSESAKLETLYCDNTNLKNLNLSGANNIKNIFCSNSQINELDISNKIFLQSVSCYNNKNLEILKVKGTTALDILDCSNTKIRELDLSESIKLGYINCSNAQISTLDVSNKPALETISCHDNPNLKTLNFNNSNTLKSLYCNKTEISELDLSECKALTMLSCDFTNISELNLSGYSMLKELNCSKNPNLKILKLNGTTALKNVECRGTSIEELDLSDAILLNSLSCSDNPNLKTLKIEAAVNLTELGCSDTGINMLDVSNSPALKKLYCKNAPLAYLNIGTNNNLITLEKSPSYNASVEVTTDSFKLQEVIKGIDPSKVSIISGADTRIGNDGTVSGYKAGTPIVYTYDCGTSANNTPQSMNVSLTLKGLKAKSSIAITENLNKVYDGKVVSKEPTVNKSGSSGVVSYQWEKYDGKDWQVIPLAPTDVGTYRVIATLAEDDTYREATSAAYEFSITQADSKISILEDLGKDYDGQAVSKEPTVSKSGSNGVVSYQWEKYDGKDWQVISLVPTDVGTYRVIATLAESTNYKKATSPAKEFAITKASNSWKEEVTIVNWTYGMEAKKPTSLATFGKAVYTYSQSPDKDFKDVVPTTAGTWYVKASIDGTDNYQALVDVKEFEINKAPAPTFTIPDALSGVQDEYLSTVTLSNGWVWVDGKERLSGNKTSYQARILVDDANYDYSVVEGYDSTGHYVERAIPVSVLAIANSWIEEPGITGWTYKELPHTPTGKAAHGTVQFVYSDSLTGIFTTNVPTTAGTWYVKAYVPASNEYTLLSKIIEFTIAKATPSYVVPQDLQAMYGQTLQDVALPDGFSWTDKTLSVGNLGTSTFTVVYTPTDSSYKTITDIPVTVTVHKIKNTQIRPLSIENWTYGQAPASATVTFTYGQPRFLYSNKIDGTYTETVPSTVGIWYVKAVVDESDFYMRIESNPVAFMIEPKNAGKESPLEIPDITADTNLDDMLVKDGDIILVAGKDYDISKVEAGDKGTVTIVFKGNYTGTITKTYTLNHEEAPDDIDNNDKQVEDTPSDEKKDTIQTESMVEIHPATIPSAKTDDSKTTSSTPTGDSSSIGTWTVFMTSTALLMAFLIRKKDKEEIRK